MQDIGIFKIRRLRNLATNVEVWENILRKDRAITDDDDDGNDDV